MADLYENKVIRTLAEKLARAECVANVTEFVCTLADKNGGARGMSAELATLIRQARALRAPVLDYESAAREAGWAWDEPASEFRLNDKGDGAEDIDRIAQGFAAKNWYVLCYRHGIAPHQREVYEFWSVTASLAEDLKEIGERVDDDFAGHNVWARTATGTSLAMDSTILDVAKMLTERPFGSAGANV